MLVWPLLWSNSIGMESFHYILQKWFTHWKTYIIPHGYRNHSKGSSFNRSVSPNIKFCGTLWSIKCFLQVADCCCYRYMFSGLFPPVLRIDLQPGKYLGILDYLVHRFLHTQCSACSCFLLAEQVYGNKAKVFTHSSFFFSLVPYSCAFPCCCIRAHPRVEIRLFNSNSISLESDEEGQKKILWHHNSIRSQVHPWE